MIEMEEFETDSEMSDEMKDVISNDIPKLMDMIETIRAKIGDEVFPVSVVDNRGKPLPIDNVSLDIQHAGVLAYIAGFCNMQTMAGSNISEPMMQMYAVGVRNGYDYSQENELTQPRH